MLSLARYNHTTPHAIFVTILSPFGGSLYTSFLPSLLKQGLKTNSFYSTESASMDAAYPGDVAVDGAMEAREGENGEKAGLGSVRL